MASESERPEQDVPPSTVPESAGDTDGASDAPTGESGEASVADLLAEAEQRVQQLREQLMRTAADFDNFRKRSRREQEDARSQGREGMLKDLLPVFDNLERAMAAAGSAVDLSSFASGIEMVARQFQDTLTRVGIERVTSVGVAFDPAFHEAIQHLETTDAEPGSVVAEVQGGYRAGQRLIRPAMVVVAKAPPGDSGSGQ